jgi:hypothetical protein
VEGDKAAADKNKHEDETAAAAKKPEGNDEDKAAEEQAACLQDAGLPSHYFTCFPAVAFATLLVLMLRF